MKALHVVTWILLVIGGLNWLLATINIDLATWFSAPWWAVLVRLVYLLVGISALVQLFTHKKDCKACEVAPVSNSGM